MYLIGLTGGIGSGKSTVCGYFKELRCPIIDADVIAYKVVEPGSKAWKLIVKNFGEEVLLPTQEINRKLLGSIVFADPDKRKVLNQCTHPYIRKEIAIQVIWNFIKGEKFVILDAPLLYESKLSKWMKKVIVVSCSEELQLERIMKRNDYTAGEAKQRINAQIPLSEKCKWADFVIDNSASLQHTREQVGDVYNRIKTISRYRGLYLWISVVTLAILLSSTLLLFL